MKDMAKDDDFVTRVDPATGVEWRARIDGPDRATVLNPANGDEVARITIRPDGVPTYDTLDPTTGQETGASPCAQGCPYGRCDGDFEKATKCALGITAREFV